MASSIKILQIVGKKKSGKTTTTIDFIKAARELDLKVAAFKRTHHASVSMDIEGTDSYRFAEVGATQVGMQNEAGFFWHETRTTDENDLEDEIRSFVQSDTDLILAEGFHQEKYPRLLLLRPQDSLIDRENYTFIGTIYPEVLKDDLIDLTTEEKRKDWLKTWID